MTTDKIGLYFGYKIKECDLKEYYKSENNKDGDDSNDSDNSGYNEDFDIWSFRDFVDKSFVGKYISKISCDSLYPFHHKV